MKSTSQEVFHSLLGLILDSTSARHFGAVLNSEITKKKHKNVKNNALNRAWARDLFIGWAETSKASAVLLYGVCERPWKHNKNGLRREFKQEHQRKKKHCFEKLNCLGHVPIKECIMTLTIIKVGARKKNWRGSQSHKISVSFCIYFLCHLLPVSKSLLISVLS